MRCPPSSSRAFTLLESLIAVVLIGVVLMMVWAGSQTAMSFVKEGRSTANLRTISQGLLAYHAEHQHLPESAINCTYRGSPVYFWFNAIGPYVEGDDYLSRWEFSAQRPAWQQCPGRSLTPPALHWKRGISVGYGWNHNEFGYDGNDLSRERYGFNLRLSDVDQPSATIIIGTNREKLDDGTPIKPDDSRNLFIYSNKPDSSRFRNAGLYLMLDGHVKRLTYAEAMADNGRLFKRKHP